MNSEWAAERRFGRCVAALQADCSRCSFILQAPMAEPEPETEWPITRPEYAEIDALHLKDDHVSLGQA